LNLLERLGLDTAFLVERAILAADLAGLVQEAEVGTFDVERDRRDRTLFLGKVREDRARSSGS